MVSALYTRGNPGSKPLDPTPCPASAPCARLGALPPENASPEGFTVRDRRGQGAEPDAARPAERAPSVRSEGAPAPPERAEAVLPGGVEAPPAADLAALFLLLANSALFDLGEGPDAMGEAAPVDFAQAQFSIDLLRLLREKTEGHRSPEESRLLDGILYDLELRFVHAVRSR